MKVKKSMAVLLCIGFLFSGAAVYAGVLNGILPVASASELDSDQVVDEVLSYVETQREDDPLMEVESGIWVKTSNVKGVKVNGDTYYYSLWPHMSFDPVARGEVTEDEVDVVYEDDDSDMPLVIYRMKNSY